MKIHESCKFIEISKESSLTSLPDFEEKEMK